MLAQIPRNSMIKLVAKALCFLMPGTSWKIHGVSHWALIQSLPYVGPGFDCFRRGRFGSYPPISSRFKTASLVTGKKSLNKNKTKASYISERIRFRCSFRVGIEVLLAVRCEQRPPSWPHCPSERLGEGVKTSSSWGRTQVRPSLFLIALRFYWAQRLPVSKSPRHNRAVIPSSDWLFAFFPMPTCVSSGPFAERGGPSRNARFAFEAPAREIYTNA
jgi:hypothetical protein